MRTRSVFLSCETTKKVFKFCYFTNHMRWGKGKQTLICGNMQITEQIQKVNDSNKRYIKLYLERKN